ncbi:MAG: hypothetical protein K1X67_09550 [Fimbriimonadaceae bacterium]|nr:hypothetical protein [Fimbriimonadaceae bacterium]
MSPIQIIDGRIVLLELSELSGGRETVLTRLPREGGIYAWYRKISLGSEGLEPEAYADRIDQMIRSKHFADRSAVLAPTHRVTLSSQAALSPSKRAVLSRIAGEPEFRQTLDAVLQHAVLFSRPLYIGKAGSIRDRIDQHLSPQSVLRARFASAGIAIDTCTLLYVPVPSLSSTTESTALRDDEAPPDEGDESDAAVDELDSNAIVEDVLSRLFHPAFTIRYG